MSDRLLFIDTETGGINPDEHSLLSIGIVVWEQENILFEDEFYIKDTVYKTTPQAISINNIDIAQLDKIGLEKQEVIKRLKKIIKQYFDNTVVTIAGHNIAFDISFLKRLYKNNNCDFSDDFSHRMIDTSSILQFLYFSGKLERNMPSSDAAFEYFNIDVAKRHSALDDCRATAQLFNKLISLER